METDTQKHGNQYGTAPSVPANTHNTHHHAIPICLPLLAILSIILLVSLLAVIIALLRRQKSTKSSGYCSDKSNGGIKNTNFDFMPHSTTIHFASSPEVKGGCIQRGNLGLVPSNVRFKGVQVFTYRELEEATDKFSEGSVIGNGRLGVVYRGTLRDGTVAAIKMLHKEGKHGERAFRMEVDLLSRLHSPYLVELLGYCADQQHRVLVFELMPNNSLQHQLHSYNQHKTLDWATRLRIALDCARALEFLHEHSTPSIIHRNFKCSSILLDRHFGAKVSSLGLAKTGSDKINGQILTRVLGTTGYLAPEYASTGKLTTKSDVYSYGVVLLEILTGRVPIDITRPAGEHVLVSWALPRLTSREKVVGMVDPVLQGRYPMKDLIQVAAIAALCVQPEADYRPLMTDIVQSLIPLVKNLSPVHPSASSRCLNQMLSPRS